MWGKKPAFDIPSAISGHMAASDLALLEMSLAEDFLLALLIIFISAVSFLFLALDIEP